MVYRVLRSIGNAAILWAIWFAAFSFTLLLTGSVDSWQRIAWLAAAIAFSCCRPSWRRERWSWVLFDVLCFVSMLWAFRGYDERLAYWQFAVMRGHAYYNVFHSSNWAPILSVIAIFAGFLLFGLTAQLYVMLVVAAGLFFGAIVSVIED